MKLRNLLFTDAENSNMKNLIKDTLNDIRKVFSIGGIDYNKNQRVYRR